MGQLGAPFPDATGTNCSSIRSSAPRVFRPHLRDDSIKGQGNLSRGHSHNW